MTDIFQSPGDRLRFEILLKSLTEGSINLAVLSEHDMVLDYYGNLFEERLRAKGNHQVEFCFSTNSERLVQKFNEILSELTLNQALEKDKKHAPRRFLIFRDSILMQDFELQLLARLVNGFPAGNINVILLINSADAYKNKLEAFGKNLLQWEVETQAGEAKKPLTDWVAESPKDAPSHIEPTLNPFVAPSASDDEAPTEAELLKLPTKTSWRVPGFGSRDKVPPVLEPLPPAPSALPLTAEPVQSTATFLASAAALPATPVSDISREPTLHANDALATPAAADVEVFKRPRKSPWGWLVLVFLLSLAAFGLMYKDLLMQEVEAFKKYLLKGTPAAVVSAQDAELAASAASAAAAASASAEAASTAASAAVVMASAPASAPVAGPVSAAASAVASAVPVVAPVAAVASAPLAAVASAVPVVAPVAAVASAPLAAVVPPPVKAVEKLAPKVAEKTQPKEPTAGPDDAWVDQLPVNGYVVQLAAFDTEADIAAFKRSNAVYAKSRVIRAPKKDSDKRYFILLAGPFATKAQADAFMQTNPLLSKGWLRSVKALRSQFNKP